MKPHLTLGHRGEDIALRHLEAEGMVLLDRNWRCDLGELDLVLTDRTVLVVCEVKTRSGTGYGTPAEAVDDRKAARIRTLAHRWRTMRRIRPCETRFDIVSVLWPPGQDPMVRHLKGAF